MADSILSTTRTLQLPSNLQTIKYLTRTLTLWVSITFNITLRIVNYEYSHNPDLFNHTRVGKIEAMRKTMQDGGNGTSMGAGNTLGKAGATTIGFNRSASSATSSVSSSDAGKAGMTSHWKTTYNGVAEGTLSKPAHRAERPLWSLPRQAYSSKRSYF